MNARTTAVSGRVWTRPGNAASLSWALLALLLPPILSACGPAEAPPEPPALHGQAQDLAVINGLAFNGLAFNGLAFNGLAFNGLAFNGLSSSEFQAWFQQEPSLRDMLMRYLVQCAVAAGEVRTFTDVATGISYTWQGNLGLAPDWASGKPATVKEQQVVSACLAAHGNKYGVKLPISVLGRGSMGVTIPYTSSELSTFVVQEGCFFGNLFNNEGVYAASDSSLLHADESTARGCALSSVKNDTSQECAPLVRLVDECGKFCTPDASKKFYTSCTYNGIAYAPITTRIRQEEIYTCGDGICQISEKCGTGTMSESCMSDCGVCP